MSMMEGAPGKSIWDIIRAAREAEETAAEKMEELAELLESISEKWDKISMLVSREAKKNQVTRYKPGVCLCEELTNVSDPGQVLDRLAQENKPPG